MKIIETGGMFTEIVNNYKREKKHCRTNMIFMQNEINDLIDGGKLYYDLIEGVLWFFLKHEGFYIAYFYLPKEEKLRLIPQDLDVIVELYGNNDRYNSDWETELMETGFEKYHKSFEYMTKKEGCQKIVEKRQEKLKKFVEKMDCYCRIAKKEDYEAMYQLWRSKIDNYAVHRMTEKEIEEMERYNRGHLILNKNNEILAASNYTRVGNAAIRENIVALQKGFGPAVSILTTAYALKEGCDKMISWVWEDNKDIALNINPDRLKKGGATVKTGRFCQQFLMRKAEC